MNLDLELARQTFLTESRDLLVAFEDGLLALEAAGDGVPVDAEQINAVFRAAHTIKGSAGLFGYDAIVAFTHVVENALDRVRAGTLAWTRPLGGLLLDCRDHIDALVACTAERGETPDAAMRSRDTELLAALQQILGGQPAAAAVPAGVAAAEVERCAGDCASADTWHISIRFGTNVLQNGMDPLTVLRYLGTLGRIVHVTTLLDALPEPAAFDAEHCYLGCEIDLASSEDRETIAGAFEFVRADSVVHILPPHSRLAEYVELIRSLPEDDARLGEILVAGGALTAEELDVALGRQAAADLQAPGAHRPLGELLVDQGLVAPAVVETALDKQQRARDPRSSGGEQRQLRIRADKLDELINRVGELVIASAATALLARRNKDPELHEATAALGALVEAIRDSALNLRTVPIGETFARFRRVVHDLSRELGKDIELELSGEDTELDKSVVERIADPLTHLVRNSLDHGIEPAEVRIAHGKPARGTLRLDARHDSGSIVIEVSDDGGGLNRERILERARERGLVRAGETPGDAETLKLIFEPGFSTAPAVTSLSGRGVGMDVVRRAIEALRGSIELESEPGHGTTVRIRLPLTLAIIDGFLVGVDGATYVVPLDNVVECVELAGATAREAERNGYLNLRGRVLPLLRLRAHFGLAGEPPRRENLVVVSYAGLQVGLVVDRLLGEFQTVIKPLGRLFTQVRGFSGATILGSGAVALILDVPGLIAAGQQAARSVPGLAA